MAVGLFYQASNQCHLCDREGFCCSTAGGTLANLGKQPYGNRRFDSSSISFRCRNPYFGTKQSYWLSPELDIPMAKVRVAADHPDSVPESPMHIGVGGYHPLEEIKGRRKVRDLRLTHAEIARTTVEANQKALLVFPGRFHNEPHGHVSWTEFRYIIDDYGDIFFEVSDDENIVQDDEASNDVTVLIGIDSPVRWMSPQTNNFHSAETRDRELNEDYKSYGTEITDVLIEWGMPDTLRYIHPLYFAKCLTKSVNSWCGKILNHPSNGLCIMGCLRPVLIDEMSYIRRLLHPESSEGYTSDWKDELDDEEEQATRGFDLIDEQVPSFNPENYKGDPMIYKLEILSIELLSVYGDQAMVRLEDFQDAEPDLLVGSAPAIIKRLSEHKAALRTLCRKKKGLNVEEASVIGVDSLGIDVRVSAGLEIKTLRIPFTSRALSESAAEKKIRRMLFPQCQRKKLKTPQ